MDNQAYLPFCEKKQQISFASSRPAGWALVHEPVGLRSEGPRRLPAGSRSLRG